MTLGNLLTLPVGGGLLYVQPVYVRASGTTAFPLSRATVVAFGNKLAWSDTLTAPSTASSAAAPARRRVTPARSADEARDQADAGDDALARHRRGGSGAGAQGPPGRL